MYTKLRQRGEVTLTLALVGLFVALFGMGLGVSSVRTAQTRNTEAQTMVVGDWPYRSELTIKDELGNVVPWVEGLNWSNDLSTPSNPLKSDGSPDARVLWNTGSVPTSPINYRANYVATVRLSFPPRYTPIKVFCTSPQGACPPQDQLNDPYKISGIRIVKDASVDYGVIVKANPTQEPTSQVPPVAGNGDMEVKVVALNYPQRTQYWDGGNIASQAPTACVRQGGTDERPLYLSSVTVEATCVGGGCVAGQVTPINIDKNKAHGTFQNLPAGQYKLNIKGPESKGYHLTNDCASKVYTVTAYKLTQEPILMLENEAGAQYEKMDTESDCKDFQGKPNLIQGQGVMCYFPNGKQIPEPEEPEQPAPIPGTGALQCERRCVYSEQKPNDKVRCYTGACPDNAPNCGGGTENINQGCKYAGDACGFLKEVDCGNLPPVIPIPPRDLPISPPTQPKDPSDPRQETPDRKLPEKNSACDKQLAYCMTEKSCLQEGGSLTGSGGCKNTSCCKLGGIVENDYQIVLLNPMEFKMDKSGIKLKSRRRRIPNLVATVKIENIKRNEEERFQLNWNDYKNENELTKSRVLDYITYIPNFGSTLKVSFKPVFRPRDPIECWIFDKLCLIGNSSTYWTKGTKVEVTLRGCDKPVTVTYEPGLLDEGRRADIPETTCYLPPLANRRSHTLSAEVKFINQDDTDPEYNVPQVILFAPNVILPDSMTSSQIKSGKASLCSKSDPADCEYIPFAEDGTLDTSQLEKLTQTKDLSTVKLGCSITLVSEVDLFCDPVDYVPDERMYLTVAKNSLGMLSAQIVTETSRADFDKNGIVNGQDFAFLIDDAVYQKGSEGDINGDKKSDAVDYTLMLGLWGKQKIAQ